MENESMMLDINQLSVEIYLSVKTIRSVLTNNPKSLPPRLIIPGQKKLLWLREDVVSFYRAQTRVQGVNPAFKPVIKNPVPFQKRRGRPTKAEQVALWKSEGTGSK